MTQEGKFIVSWIVVIILMLAFMVGVNGLFNYTDKKLRNLCGLLSFSSMITLILLSNLL